MLLTEAVPKSVLIHVWMDSEEGPQFLCGMDAEDVIAAVSDRRIHEFPMDMVCPDCLRAFASRRLNVRFHISTGESDEIPSALCGAEHPEYLVRGKYADGLNDDDWCPKCKAEWEKRRSPSRTQ
jgi:hypothetical protein